MGAPVHKNAPVFGIPVSNRLVNLVLLLATVTASVGWFLAAHHGRGVPPECYTLEGDSSLRFDATHGSATTRSTFAVAESEDQVMLGN